MAKDNTALAAVDPADDQGNAIEKTDGRSARKGQPRVPRPTHFLYGQNANGDLEIFLATKDTEEVLAKSDELTASGTAHKRTKMIIK